jgi:hypothetical protein
MEIALCIGVEMDENLEDIDKAARCYVHFTQDFMSVLNVKQDISNDERVHQQRCSSRYSDVKCTEDTVETASGKYTYIHS